MQTAITVHLLMPDSYPGDAFAAAIVAWLKERLGIDHATVQIEADPGADCPPETDPAV